MSRYIDADTADKLLESFIDSKQNAFSPTEYIAGLQRAKKIISVLPTADVQEVKHGKWKNDVCTYCGIAAPCFLKKREYDYALQLAVRLYDYCPHCGAKMDLEEEQ